jgi:hypothetical protein
MKKSESYRFLKNESFFVAEIPSADKMTALL